MTYSIDRKIKVAVIGAGPGGLAAAIFLRRLDFVDLTIFDQANLLREVGAGISINENTWRLLNLLGADTALEQHATRVNRDKVNHQQRNGKTGELVLETGQQAKPGTPAPVRIERYKVQNALLQQLPLGFVHLGKRLDGIEETDEGVVLSFDDGTSHGPVDLVVGADGIRSKVRQYAFPDHKLSYTGKVAYRVLIPQEKVAHIPDLPRCATFWHTRSTHVYTGFLDNGLFEIATRAVESEEHEQKVSWGQQVPKENVIHHYEAYCDTIRQVIKVPDEWLEFAMFGGPRLEHVVRGGRIALLGDASHPLAGAFGSGAAFAFEDAFVLSSALLRSFSQGDSIQQALKVYDAVRSPRYKDLYGVLDDMQRNAARISASPLDEDTQVNEIMRENWTLNKTWIYTYDISKVWSRFLVESQARSEPSFLTPIRTTVVTA